MNINFSIILTCLTLTVIVDARNIKPRILSFKSSPINLYPFYATLVKNGVYSCTAALITKSQLLSVAQCVQDVVQQTEYLPHIIVRFGSIKKGEGFTRRVRRISHQIGFAEPSKNFYINDISVIHTSHPITLGDTVSPLKLPVANAEIPAHVLILLSSLGGHESKDYRTLPPLLMRIITKLENRDLCQNWFMEYVHSTNQVCIDINTEFEFGSVDMGGPMVDFLEETILGLASTLCYTNGCNAIPKIFTRVSDHLPYILDEILYDTPNYIPAVVYPARNFPESFPDQTSKREP